MAEQIIWGKNQYKVVDIVVHIDLYVALYNLTVHLVEFADEYMLDLYSLADH